MKKTLFDESDPALAAAAEKLSPLFKWTGGKRREIATIKNYFPSFIKDGSSYKYVEPFAGGAALFWYLNNVEGENVINDFDVDVVNLFQQVKEQNREFLDLVKESSALYKIEDNHSNQQENYYYWRSMDKNNGLEDLSPAYRAARFWIVNQLAFSGMRRFNSKGEFNVPYGHYKNLNSIRLANDEHVNLLSNTELLQGDYKSVMENNDDKNTFIFIDPPYTRVMKTYSHDNEFGEDKQYELFDTLDNLKNASWMVVINKSELTEKIYSNHITHTYSLQYGVNIKNRIDTNVEHIIATNY